MPHIGQFMNMNENHNNEHNKMTMIFTILPSSFPSASFPPLLPTKIIIGRVTMDQRYVYILFGGAILTRMSVS